MDAEAIEMRSMDPADPVGARLLGAVEAELAELYADRSGSIHSVPARAGEMRPPDGGFVVVFERGRAIGCGGLKRLDGDTCEIKRMYLQPPARGRGLSVRLLAALEERARRLGYARARLDTGHRQPSALRLYTSAGYRRIPDYNANPLASFWFEKEL